MKLAKGILGEKLFIMAMKATFYGHFVAGEDQYKIRPKLERLRSFGVKPILDYSVEEDLSQEEAEKREVEYVVCMHKFFIIFFFFRFLCCIELRCRKLVIRLIQSPVHLNNIMLIKHLLIAVTKYNLLAPISI